MRFLILFLLCIVGFSSKGNTMGSADYQYENLSFEIFDNQSDIDNPVFRKIKSNIDNRRKLIAAGLALPVPFGILGLHRVYLGTKAYVPLVYIATLGGCLGIVPFIDMVVLLIEKDTHRFDQNSQIFMWIKK